MKKSGKFLVFIMSVSALLLVLAGCSAKALPYVTPVAWTKYLEEVADIAGNQFKTDEILSVEIKGSSIVNNTRKNFYFGLNYNLNDIDNSKMVIEITDKANQNIFSIKADNRDTYLDIGQNDYISSAKLKLEQTNLFGFLCPDFDIIESPDNSITLKNVLIEVGKRLFDGVNVNKDKSVYSFSLNADAQKKEIKYLTDILLYADKSIAKIFLGVLGITDFNTFFDSLPLVDGEINFYVEDNKITGIDATNLTIGGDKNGNIQLEIITDNQEITDLKDRFPLSDDGYKVTKLGCSKVDGSINLLTSQGNKRAVKYDIELNSNLDLMKLLYYDYDLSKLADDNYFHLRISHKCDSHCTEFCRSKIKPSKGAILDIAFSPKDFKTHNLYIDFNLKAIISEEYRAERSKYYSNMTENLLPDYVLLTYSPEILDDKEYITRFFIDLYSSIIGLSNRSIDFKTSDFKEIFKDSALASLIFNDFFKSEEYDNDIIQLKITDNIYGQNDEYDIYKDTVFIIDENVSELKNYSTDISGLTKDFNMLGWSYENEHTAKEKYNPDIEYSLNNIYSKDGANLLHGTDGDGYYVPLSDIEAKSLIGCAVKYSYTDYRKNTIENNYATIIDVMNLDLSNTSTPQEVEVKIKSPSALDYLWGLGNTTADVLNRLFDYTGSFTENITLKIKLTKEVPNTFVLDSADQSAASQILFREKNPEILKGSAKISYVNGCSKTITVSASGEDIVKEPAFVDYNYSIASWGSLKVNYDVAGRHISRYINIKTPDAFELTLKPFTGEINTTCFLTNYIILNAVYNKDDGSRDKVQIYLDLKDIYINNISLDQDSNDWGHYKSFSANEIVFYKSNDYQAEIRKNGYTSEKFVITILGKQYQKPTYKFQTDTLLDGILFANSPYIISGGIVNKTHGSGVAQSYNLKLNLYEGSYSNGALVYNKADESSYESELVVGDVSSASGEIDYLLPIMIEKPITVKIRFVIKKAGNYKLNFTMNGSAVYQIVFSVI